MDYCNMILYLGNQYMNYVMTELKKQNFKEQFILKKSDIFAKI